MSQKEVAERLGCSRKCVSEFETGLTSPSFGFVVAYVDLVGARLVYTGPEGDHLDFV
ncbi:helix-turn-helix domain-containing protein [Agrobacterium rubi]|nr:helix-turn-helix domain-containing protein [Agrobacterium rubi]NTF23645.1 helix-turn-helix domain-containing protein [Agrobacterium rubi]